jgi:hypothetical protein
MLTHYAGSCVRSTPLLTRNTVRQQAKRVLHRESLKGQCHEISGPLFFSLNGTPGCPDSWAKAYSFEFAGKSDSIRLRKSTRRYAE